jgi:hypothetical protein
VVRLFRRARESASTEVEVKFEPRDLWVGVYWSRDEYGSRNWRTRRLRVFVCIIPMLPIVFTFERDVE